MISIRRGRLTAHSDAMTNPGSEILIKRYGGGRLYNTHTAAYVSLDDLAELVLTGRRFTVRDASTGEDITRKILDQLR